jgi:UDP-glucuronate decarboxylase
MKINEHNILIDDALNLLNVFDLRLINNKSILITGASGLLGLSLVATLYAAAKMKGVDFKLTVIFRSEPEQPLSNFLTELNASVFVLDLADQSVLNHLDYYDLIIHAAGYGQPGKFLADPIKTISLNTTVTINLLKLLNVNGKFLFVSSSEVYSGCAALSFTEQDIGTTTPQHPRSSYIEGKRSGEAICFAAYQSGVNAYSARVALAYGPGARYGDQRVLYNFIESGIKNGHIRLLDQGEALRTYCYVTDALEIFSHILSEGTRPVYNVGGKSKVSIKRLAQMIGKRLNVPVSFPESNSGLVGSPTSVELDMSFVDREFSKSNYRDLESGLDRTIQWFLSLH